MIEQNLMSKNKKSLYNNTIIIGEFGIVYKGILIWTGMIFQFRELQYRLSKVHGCLHRTVANQPKLLYATIACKEHMLQTRTCTHVAVHVHMHISI